MAQTPSSALAVAVWSFISHSCRVAVCELGLLSMSQRQEPNYLGIKDHHSHFRSIIGSPKIFLPQNQDAIANFLREHLVT